MKTTILVLFTSTFLCVCILPAAERKESSADFQFRVPFHLMYLSSCTNYGRLGLGAWNIFSDFDNVEDRTAQLRLIGPWYGYGNKGSWVELLGGCRTTADGFDDPVIDIRLFDRSLPLLVLGGEIAYFPRSERRRLYSLLSMDTPVAIVNYEFRIGIESENIISFSGKDDSWGIGPRLVFPIPLRKVSSRLSSTLTVAYQSRNDRDFLRCYMGFAYKLGK